LRPDDVFIAADDDSTYRPFFVEELARSVWQSGGAASFYVYENRGLWIGQGADGFAMTGALAQTCADIVPLLEQHELLRRHDDYWISFLLRKQGVVPATYRRFADGAVCDLRTSIGSCQMVSSVWRVERVEGSSTRRATSCSSSMATRHLECTSPSRLAMSAARSGVSAGALAISSAKLLWRFS